ncbi:probable cytochrome P450 301a1, mitochondrial [Ischnura elegans]|uniref:probable cytochrome P450 301a1, mitochondrial n=1 Tax=Ischnura elegans TaxID=197161 RepID=UPI001ED882A6|nr:probable cytochrome P450 301a1, mitochondrial [Ischnura elegans]
MCANAIQLVRAARGLLAAAAHHHGPTPPPCRPSSGVAAPPLDHATAARPYDEIPGPKPLPLLGNSWRFFPLIGEYAGLESDDLHRTLYEQYGPIVRFTKILGRRDLVFIFRPEDVETTLRNEGPWPYREGTKSMEYYRQVHRKDFYQGAGSVLTDHGPKWGEVRSKVNQPMMQPRISRRYVPPIEGVAQEFLQMIRDMRDESGELPSNFVNELFKWSLESIAYVALDTRLGCLEPSLASDSEQQTMIDAVNTILNEMYNMELGMPLWKLIPTPAWRKFVKAQDTFLEVTMKRVQSAIERVQQRGHSEDDDPSVLERLLSRADPKTATIMAQDMLFGGIDTTSFSTAIAMYMLSRNKEKQEILFEEMKRFLPEKDTPISEEMLEEMKYLKAVFKECMRMKPLVPWNQRKTVKETVLSNYRVPQGVDVLMPNLTFRDSEEIYPQGQRFIPERWLKKRPVAGQRAGSAEDFDAVSHGKHHPFAFLPFGFGVRMCVGKRFAEMEMEILLAKIVRNFKVDYKYGEIRFTSKLINTPVDPLRFQLTDRSE